LIRSKAHKTGQFYKIGRLMLLTRQQVVSLIEGPADRRNAVEQQRLRG
jgi:hypothetical protein